MAPEEALSIVDILTRAYPNATIPEATIELYMACLYDVPFEAGRVAALNLITEKNFFPTIAEVRQAALSVIPANHLPDAAQAWAEVTTQMAECGYFESPIFSHPAIVAAVKAVGWSNLCHSEKIAVDRAHFVKIYDTYRDRHHREIIHLPEAKALALGMQGKDMAQLNANSSKAMNIIQTLAQGKGA